MSLILAIDPGTTQSGWVLCRDGDVLLSGVHPNWFVREMLIDDIPQFGVPDLVAIEMMKARGMPTSNDEFLTCVEIGRFVECREPDPWRFIYRNDVKLHLCGSSRAKDANIRAACIALLGPPGTKKAKGPTYGVTSHAWQALGVALTAEAQLAGVSP